MDTTIILIGLATLSFGVFVGVVGITTAARLIKRFAGLPDVDTAIHEGNIAVGISLAGAIFAMGLMVQNAVQNTFSALDLLRYSANTWVDVTWVFAYAIGLILAALVVGAGVIIVGVRASVRLTPNIDEIEEIRNGNIACAIVMAVVLGVMGLLAREGLDTLLTGLLPLPPLGQTLD